MLRVTLVLSALLLVQGARPGFDITSGEGAVAGEFPYQASLVLRSPRGKDRIICGGSVLNERWILSSASCELKPKVGSILVKVGQHRRDRDGEYVQTKEVGLVIVHKNFRKRNWTIKEYDLALVKLTSPLLLNERVQSVSLPVNKSNASGAALLTGFGAISSRGGLRYPSVLQKAEVVVISRGNCEDAISSVSPANNGRLTDRHICTGPLDGTITACADDLGNPLVQRNENGTVQIGVVSWNAIPCGLRGSPTVYTRISDYVDWINERISEN